MEAQADGPHSAARDQDHSVPLVSYETLLSTPSQGRRLGIDDFLDAPESYDEVQSRPEARPVVTSTSKAATIPSGTRPVTKSFTLKRSADDSKQDGVSTSALSSKPRPKKSPRGTLKDMIERVKALTGEAFPVQRKPLFNLPIKNRNDDAPLNSLPTEVIRTIVDFIYFPDAFSFALSCKWLAFNIDLQAKKDEYRAALRQYARPIFHQDLNRDFCDVCLYRLRNDQFVIKLPLSARNIDDPRVCRMCQTFRDKVAAGIDQRHLALPWRSSRIKDVPSQRDVLWYRDAV